MLYHYINIKYVQYGTIEPHFDEDNFLNVSYKWLSFYCGYFPQIWLSRSDINMTGWRLYYFRVKNKWIQENKNNVLFGFDEHKINGKFYVDMNQWGMIINSIDNFTNEDKISLNLLNKFKRRFRYTNY